MDKKINWNRYMSLSREDVIDIIQSGLLNSEEFITQMFGGKCNQTLINNLLEINNVDSSWGRFVLKSLKQQNAPVSNDLGFVLAFLRSTEPKYRPKVYNKIGEILRKDIINMSAIFREYPTTFEGLLSDFDANLDLIAYHVANDPEKLIPVVYNYSPSTNKLLEYMNQEGYDLTDVKQALEKAIEDRHRAKRTTEEEGKRYFLKNPTPKRPSPTYRKGLGGKTYFNHGNGYQPLR